MPEQYNLRPYSGEQTTCPKCGGGQVGTAYRRGRDYMLCYNVDGCPWGEHHHRTCHHCHYTWAEAVINADALRIIDSHDAEGTR